MSVYEQVRWGANSSGAAAAEATATDDVDDARRSNYSSNGDVEPSERLTSQRHHIFVVSGHAAQKETASGGDHVSAERTATSGGKQRRRRPTAAWRHRDDDVIVGTPRDRVVGGGHDGSRDAGDPGVRLSVSALPRHQAHLHRAARLRLRRTTPLHRRPNVAQHSLRPAATGNAVACHLTIDFVPRTVRDQDRVCLTCFIKSLILRMISRRDLTRMGRF